MHVLRRLRIVLAIAVMALLVPVAAAADEPVTSTVVLVHEDEPNPCRPGETNTVTIVFTLETHEHNNNVVRVLSADESTDDGFVGSGHQTDVFVNGIRRTTVKHMMHNPETGERFSVTIRFWLDLETFEIVKGLDMPELRCIRAV